MPDDDAGEPGDWEEHSSSLEAREAAFEPANERQLALRIPRLDRFRTQAVDTHSDAPILRLPDEILCMVLGLVADLEPPCQTYGDADDHDNDPYLVNNALLGFTRLSKVCMRFRTVLLAMHTLWAAAVFSLPREAAMLALSRSHSAPMVVVLCRLIGWEIHDENPDLEYHVATASKNAERICSLSTIDVGIIHHKAIFLRPMPLLKELCLLFLHPADPPNAVKDVCIDAPLLQAVHMEFQCRREDEEEGEPFEPTEQGLSFFNELSRGFTFKLPALRSLVVDLGLPHAQTALEPAWIVDLLSNCELLEKLELSLLTGGSHLQWEPLFRDRTIRLAHLQWLTLSGGTSANLPDLFAHLNLTRPIRCLISYHHYSGDDDDYMAGVLRSIDFSGPMLHNTCYDGLELSFGDAEGEPVLYLAACRSFSNPWHYTPNLVNNTPDVFALSMLIDGDEPAQRQEYLVNRLVKAFQCHIAQVMVDLREPYAWPYARNTILKSCITTRELLVHYHWDPQSPTLSMFLPSANFLPNLDTMFVKPFFNREAGDGFLLWWEQLVVWLEYRAEAGLRIRRLHLLEPEYEDGTIVETDDENDAALCAQAAEFVDELFDERVRYLE